MHLHTLVPLFQTYQRTEMHFFPELVALQCTYLAIIFRDRIYSDWKFETPLYRQP